MEDGDEAMAFDSQVASSVPAAESRSWVLDFRASMAAPVEIRKDGHTALLMVDMQHACASKDQGFSLAYRRLSPGSTDYYDARMEELVIPTIQQLLAYFRDNGLPVVHVVMATVHRDYRDVPARFRDWVRRIERHSGVGDLLWAQAAHCDIRSELKPLKSETVVQKRSMSPFNTTNCDQLFRDLGIDNFVVTGNSTNACVESTARDASDRGYGCLVVDEGTNDYSAEAQQVSLDIFRTKLGAVARGAGDVVKALEG